MCVKVNDNLQKKKFNLFQFKILKKQQKVIRLIYNKWFFCCLSLSLKKHISINFCYFLYDENLLGFVQKPLSLSKIRVKKYNCYLNSYKLFSSRQLSHLIPEGKNPSLHIRFPQISSQRTLVVLNQGVSCPEFINIVSRV